MCVFASQFIFVHFFKSLFNDYQNCVYFGVVTVLSKYFRSFNVVQWSRSHWDCLLASCYSGLVDNPQHTRIIITTRQICRTDSRDSLFHTFGDDDNGDRIDIIVMIIGGGVACRSGRVRARADRLIQIPQIGVVFNIFLARPHRIQAID